MPATNQGLVYETNSHKPPLPFPKGEGQGWGLNQCTMPATNQGLVYETNSHKPPLPFPNGEGQGWGLTPKKNPPQGNSTHLDFIKIDIFLTTT